MEYAPVWFDAQGSGERGAVATTDRSAPGYGPSGSSP
jgi:hypothetical protein